MAKLSPRSGFVPEAPTKAHQETSLARRLFPRHHPTIPLLIGALLVVPTLADPMDCFSAEQKVILNKMLVPGKPMTVFYNRDSEIRFPSHALHKVPELRFLEGGNCGDGNNPYYMEDKNGRPFYVTDFLFALKESKYLNVRYALEGKSYERDFPHAFTEDGKALRRDGKGEWREYNLFNRTRNHGVDPVEIPLVATKWRMNDRRDSLYVRLTDVNRRKMGMEGHLSGDKGVQSVTVISGSRRQSANLRNISIKCNEAASGMDWNDEGCPSECFYWGVYPLKSEFAPMAVFMGGQDIRNIEKIAMDSVEVPGDNLKVLIPDDQVQDDWERFRISRDRIRIFNAGAIRVHEVQTGSDHRSYLLYAGEKIFQAYNDYGDSEIRVLARMEWEGRTRYLVRFTGKMGVDRGYGLVTVEDGDAVFDLYKEPVDCIDQGC